MTATTSKHDETIQIGIRAVGPKDAARWLEGNVRNRRIDQGHVNFLAQEMLAGRWGITHQGIAFDADGTLIDGQHRLWAILQSGCTVQIPVTFGLSAECIETIDACKARTVVDRLTLSGRFGVDGVNVNHASTLRQTVCGLNASEPLAYHRQSDLMVQHLDAVRFATSHVTRKAKGIGVSYVRAVIARAWYSVDHDLLIRFCRVLSDGMPGSPQDACIIKLRDQLMAIGSSRHRTIQRELYGKVERVLMAWLKGETRSVIRPVTQEFFPLPEEIAA